jgi:hypothetical protein
MEFRKKQARDKVQNVPAGSVAAPDVHGALNGMLDEFARVAQAKLFLDVGLVGLDRLYAYVQLVGDLPRAVPGSDQAENFQLAIA